MWVQVAFYAFALTVAVGWMIWDSRRRDRVMANMIKQHLDKGSTDGS